MGAPVENCQSSRNKRQRLPAILLMVGYRVGHRVSPDRSADETCPRFYSPSRSPEVGEKQLYQSHVMTLEQKSVMPFPSHDYPEYETPSQQYENGQITYFEYVTDIQKALQNTSPP